MKILKVAVAILLLAQTPIAHAGEMDLQGLIELISDRLQIQIDASSIGSPLSQRVNVPELTGLSPERVRAQMLTTLYLAGFTWIRDASTDLYRIVRLRDARDQELQVVADPANLPDSDELVTAFLPVKHVSPEYTARNLRSFMPANSRIIPDELNQTVFVTDTAHNIAKLRALIDRLDTVENAKAAAEFLASRSQKNDCPPESWQKSLHPPQLLWIALFSLIAAVIGFLSRGYMIRRIEGGL